MNRRNKLNNSRLTWIPIILVAILLMVRDLSGVSINKFVFVALTTIAFAIADKYEVYEMIAFLIPLFAGLPGNYIACIALIFILLKSGGKIHQDPIGLGCCITILLIELLSMVRGYDFSIVNYVTFAGTFLLTFMFIFDKDEGYNYWNIARNFVLGLLVAITDVVGQMLNRYSLTEFLSLGVRIGDINDFVDKNIDTMTMSYNCNALGMLCATCILMCLISSTRYKKKWTIPAGFVLLLTGIMTQSRAFIVILFLGFVLFFLTGNEKPSTTIKKILVLVICFALGIYLVMRFIPDYFENFMIRFQAEDISNGRNMITSLYWQRFINSPDKIFFGSGLQNYAAKYNMTMSAHLGFEEVLVTWGIIGLAIVLITIIRSIKIINIKRFAEYERIIPFIIYLIGLQAGQFFSQTAAFMSLIAWVAFARVTATSIVESNNKKIAGDMYGNENY